MKRPSLNGLIEWIGADLLEELDTRRRQAGEIKRTRKLGTSELIWLMLAVSLNTGRNGLYEILRLASAELDIDWNVSVAAFCKARKRFFPPASAFSSWPVGAAPVPPPRQKSRPMEWTYSQSRR